MAPRGLDSMLDASLIRASEQVLAGVEERVAVECPMSNVDRSVKAMLSHAVRTRFGAQGLPNGSVRVPPRGHAGQSLDFALQGDANGYVGKLLSGGRIAAKLAFRPTADALGVDLATEDNVTAGNGCLYERTSGELLARGGSAFGMAVVEGTGDQPMEYATGGTLLILGCTGQNFAAAPAAA